MMRSIGIRERIFLHLKKRRLVGQDRKLRSVLRVFDGVSEIDRAGADALLHKRCDLADSINEIGCWLAHGARPIVIAPCARGKGWPAGTIPLQRSNKGAE